MQAGEYEVLGGCKRCGAVIMTTGSTLIRRICDECRRKNRVRANQNLAARRKQVRQRDKQVAAQAVLLCASCERPITEAERIKRTWDGPKLVRRYCSDACRQRAYRDRGQIRRY